MPTKEVDLRCEYCGNVGGEHVKNHDIIDDCVACNDCVQMYLQTYKDSEAQIADVMDNVQAEFLKKVKCRFKVCPMCDGEGWIQPTAEHRLMQRVAQGQQDEEEDSPALKGAVEKIKEFLGPQPKKNVNTVSSINRRN